MIDAGNKTNAYFLPPKRHCTQAAHDQAANQIGPFGLPQFERHRSTKTDHRHRKNLKIELVDFFKKNINDFKSIQAILDAYPRDVFQLADHDQQCRPR